MTRNSCQLYKALTVRTGWTRAFFAHPKCMRWHDPATGNNRLDWVFPTHTPTSSISYRNIARTRAVRFTARLPRQDDSSPHRP